MTDTTIEGKQELAEALDRLRIVRDRGLPDEHAQESVNNAITEVLVAWGRLQEHDEKQTHD